jgi:outer membrane protein OmpA-like peptidoglycan-associated protein/opacity protein-like surface antigen
VNRLTALSFTAPLGLLSALILIGAVAQPAFAKHTNSKELGLFIGFNAMNENTELGNTTLTGSPPTSGLCFGGRVGVNVTEWLAAEGEMKLQPTELADNSAAGTIFGFRAGGLVHLNLGADKKFRPFAWGGFGAETLQITPRGSLGDSDYVEQDTDFALLFGVGAKYLVLKNLLVRVDLRYVNMADKSIGGTAANWEALIGLSWIVGSGPWDKDKDGIFDNVDKCPAKAEDMDGWQDKDGCPEDDNDGDNILDSVDKCPNKAEDLDKFEDDDGCPDEDNDADGIPDTADKCPNKPEDKDGTMDSDGCPDPDNDRDGIPDTDDKCPNKFGVKAERGCPVIDTDKDGIPDKVDKCPKKPETYNGIKDKDGCPERKKSTVIITKTEIKILQKVYFEVSKAEIKSKSFGLLNTVAAVLNSQPQITKIQIEGHTDDTGSDAGNLKLSQARAESVVQYMTDRGVPAGRLVAKGFGETAPVCEQVPELLKKKRKNKRKIATCREKNRRVTFLILEINGKVVRKGESAVIETKTKVEKIE